MRLRSPYVFTVLALALFVAADVYLIPGHYAYMNVNPHPYLILSAFIGSFYGLRPALFSSALSSVVYLLMVHLNLNYEEIETLLDFRYLSTPILLTVTATVVGELKQRNLEERARLTSEAEGLRRSLEIQGTRENTQTKEIIELKRRLVSRLDTARTFYEIATSFHVLDEQQLLKNFEVALSVLFKGAKIELVKVSRIQKDQGDMDHLSKEALRTGRLVTLKEGNLVRNFENSPDRILLAFPLNIDGKPEFLVRASKIPFLEYVPTQFKIAEIYASWVSSSLEFARTYQSSEENSVWNDVLQVYRWEHFRERLDEEFERSRTYMLPLSLLRLELNFENLPEEKVMLLRKLVAGVVGKNIRKLDTLAEGQGPGEFFVLLPISDESMVKTVVGTLETELPQLGTHPRFRVSSWHPDMNQASDLLKEIS